MRDVTHLKENKIMKTSDIASLVVYVIFIALAAVVGFAILAPAFKEFNTPQTVAWPFTLGAIASGLVINSILFELGHIVGAKIGGYKITSVNILYLNLYRNEKNKWKFRFKGMDGFLGQTEIAPKSEKSNPKPYLFGGTLFFILEAVAAILLFYYITPMTEWNFFPIVILAVGGMFAIYQIVPVQLDHTNDGYRLYLLGNKAINLEAFNEMLRLKDEARLGNKDIQVKVFDEITPYTSEVNFLTVYQYLAKGEYEPAIEIIDNILKNKENVPIKTARRALAQKLFMLLLIKPIEEVKTYYEENVSLEVRRFFAEDNSMESLRAYMLIAGLLDDSLGEVVYCLNRKEKAMKRCLDSRKATETLLFNLAKEKIDEAHPDWKLSDTK